MKIGQAWLGLRLDAGLEEIGDAHLLKQNVYFGMLRGCMVLSCVVCLCVFDRQGRREGPSMH